jgi:hypothetical protein
MAALPKYSPEWWSVHDAIELEADAKLAKAMIICRGCLPQNDGDRTGSIKESTTRDIVNQPRSN